MVDPPPFHQPDWNVVVDARCPVVESVNYGQRVVSKKIWSDRSPARRTTEEGEEALNGTDVVGAQ